MQKSELGTWAECMGIVRRSKMKARDPNKRIFDRYDIEQVVYSSVLKLQRFRITLYKGE